MPFATWGGVTSGLALPDLAEALQAKGFQPVGAAKVLAEHASMWAAPEPLAPGGRTLSISNRWRTWWPG